MDAKDVLAILKIDRRDLYDLKQIGMIRATLKPNGRFNYSDEDVYSLSGTKHVDTKSIPTIEQAAEILGFDMDELRSKIKIRRLADQRRIIATVLYDMGMDTFTIAQSLSKDRGSVNTMIRTVGLVGKRLKDAKEKLKKAGYE